MVNASIKKDQAKVVDSLDIEDIGDKKVFCRCWRSKTVRFIWVISRSNFAQIYYDYRILNTSNNHFQNFF